MNRTRTQDLISNLHVFLPIWGTFCLVFQIIKALSTGLWWDEAYILNPIASMLAGTGWRSDGVLFHSGITTGPALLIPGLVLSALTDGPYPPLLHLLALLHSALLFGVLRYLGVSWKNSISLFALYLIGLTFSPQLNITHFLGEFPGSIWFLIGAWIFFSPQRQWRWDVFAGVCFALSIHSKLLFVLPFLGSVGTWIAVTRTSALCRIFPAALGFSALWGLWLLFQWKEYGSLSEMTLGYEQWLNAVFRSSHGAGLQQASQKQFIKPLGMIGKDLQGLLTSGIAPILVFLWTSWKLSEFWKKKRTPAHAVAWGIAGGLAWWTLISRFDQDGAILRHASPMILIGWGSMILELGARLPSLPLLRSISKKIILLIFGFLTVTLALFSGLKSYPYLFKNKGYGTYSSWKDQKQIRDWILQHGTPQAPLPLLNCASDGAAWYGNVYLPQRVLSPIQNFVIWEPCSVIRPEKIRHFIGIQASLLPEEQKKQIQLIEGSWEYQGLFRPLP